MLTEDNNFNRDWELSERLNTLARHHLLNGFTIDETMQQVLNSEEYILWKSIPRSFQIDIDQRHRYEDLLGDIEWNKYTDRIDAYINEFFRGSKTEQPIDSAQYDHIYEGLGMQVTGKQLGYEIAKLSKMIGANKPLNYSHLLCLFNGTLISDIEEEQLDCLLAKEEEVSDFVEELFERYRIKEDKEELT